MIEASDGSVYLTDIEDSAIVRWDPATSKLNQVIQDKRLSWPDTLSWGSDRVLYVTCSQIQNSPRFNGGISLGTIYSKGNQSTQYSLAASTEYVRERWNTGARLDSNLSKSTGTTASTRNSLAFSVLHLMSKKNWFYEGVGGLLQSSEQGIALQTLLGGGVGRYLKNTNQTSIQLLGGVGWQDTTYQHANTPIQHQNAAAALIYVDARLFKFSKTNLDATVGILPAVTDPGRVRINANSSYYIKLISDLKWNISFYGNWDNQPPQGFSGSDYGVSSGLSWTYGLK